MTCKDCIHYDVCEALEIGNGLAKVHPIHCGYFKDKSRYIELPCKVGDTVYHATEFRGVVEAKVRTLFLKDNGVEYIRTTAYDVPFQEVGKTLFVGENAREKAEKALKERSKENG